MASKKTLAAFLICMVIAMAFVEKAETLSDCAKECMPVCLKEKGSTIDACSPACEEYCSQYASKNK
ncbi:hypothetical protein TanjilG_14188 [Lupinus angustifolius]|uniref:Uncharacterized protein n=1 Tax=Lupinus angustifolius TaxID=3871 RepID=A0A1J7HK58_LUPAN|nr:hypothetical protein TanjilG_14188 [Lupinus angustifolius]